MNMDALKEEARTDAARDLYNCYVEYVDARQTYQEVLMDLGISRGKLVDTVAVTTSKQVVSIFHAVQSITRRLKDSESRASVCRAAKKVIADVPAPLMLVLQHEMQSGPAVRETSETDAASVCID